MRIFIAILLILFSVGVLGFVGAGSHGHMLFRPGMLEDWIFWTLILSSGFGGIYMLLKPAILKTQK